MKSYRKKTKSVLHATQPLSSDWPRGRGGTSACNLVQGPARVGKDWVRVGWLAGASVSYWKPWAPKRDLYCIREYGYYIRTVSLFGLIKEYCIRRD